VISMFDTLKELLERNFELYNHINFIDQDPISIPHAYNKKQDIEIAGLFAAIFSWGNRKVIIAKTKELMCRMDNSPHDFVTHFTSKELNIFSNFKHRTFNGDDVQFFLRFLQKHYASNQSLENAFLKTKPTRQNKMENALNGFYHYFFEDETGIAACRTKKHIAAPEKNSTCKRLNMFLRWMVRKDTSGVDFGIWEKLQAADLICPLDIHVLRTAKQLKLLKDEKPNWQTACKLTAQLKKFDKHDPVKYDFALFGMGINNKTTFYDKYSN